MPIVQKYEQMVRVSTAAVAGAPAAGIPPTDSEKIKWLYEILTILDNKAGALLAFDGLLLAAASFMYEKMFATVTWGRTVSLLLILVALIAALVCLFVARISYEFLGRITLGTRNNAAEIDELGAVVEHRTRLQWWAWWVSVGAVAFFLVVMFIMFIKSLS